MQKIYTASWTLFTFSLTAEADRKRRIWSYTRWNSADTPFECYFTPEVIPPNNFWWLSRSPLMSSFYKQIWVVPPLNSSKVFGDPPFWVLSYDWSPFCSPKDQVILPKILPPPPRRQIMTGPQEKKSLWYCSFLGHLFLDCEYSVPSLYRLPLHFWRWRNLYKTMHLWFSQGHA